ncbi:hypothetical protein VJ923_03670 [Adlercreutzia sp. R25]|uniref:GNAT family N-acetyltransferase n=1 Tax=Adlercreutzia shanghongiae TaxID=3111773 RepID=A0ABU6IWA9_9ACTN|nr:MULTISPECIES: hypothetical protein [unclassified Adlercreutzia]MEC4272258.1 hypothetical protein [Adlercreutzia sp. R25]MEC4293986.1 hypothetical protein [Adlercreutzia sp. R22]
MVEYKALQSEEINRELFNDFIRHQVVTKCWRKENGKWARERGAGKLYISAHSAAETQAFYKSMGCVEAEVYSQKHVEDEPFDCQLECVL